MHITLGKQEDKPKMSKVELAFGHVSRLQQEQEDKYVRMRTADLQTPRWDTTREPGDHS